LENPRPFRKSFIKLYLCLFVAYMCSSTNGFDANTFGRLLDRLRPGLCSQEQVVSRRSLTLPITLT
jgi:hypothetical protein